MLTRLQDRSYLTILSLQRLTTHGSTLHHWNRDWHRHINCAYVPGKAGTTLPVPVN
jgi:hypothetical protein